MKNVLLVIVLLALVTSARAQLDTESIPPGHNRGVIPLGTEIASQGPKKPEVVDKFRRLCDAMRPPKPADKLGLLEKLADSGGPVLQKEAEIARASVQASVQGTEYPKQQPKEHTRYGINKPQGREQEYVPENLGSRKASWRP